MTVGEWTHSRDKQTNRQIRKKNRKSPPYRCCLAPTGNRNKAYHNYCCTYPQVYKRLENKVLATMECRSDTGVLRISFDWDDSTFIHFRFAKLHVITAALFDLRLDPFMRDGLSDKVRCSKCNSNTITSRWSVMMMECWFIHVASCVLFSWVVVHCPHDSKWNWE